MRESLCNGLHDSMILIVIVYTLQTRQTEDSSPAGEENSSGNTEEAPVQTTEHVKPQKENTNKPPIPKSQMNGMYCVVNVI